MCPMLGKRLQVEAPDNRYVEKEMRLDSTTQTFDYDNGPRPENKNENTTINCFLNRNLWSQNM